eukprot:m.98516 g.98516  ORF g.98516 m.98516 type:complete len:516 (+) comp15281_c0_seq1:194-1741(+)
MSRQVTRKRARRQQPGRRQLRHRHQPCRPLDLDPSLLPRVLVTNTVASTPCRGRGRQALLPASHRVSVLGSASFHHRTPCFPRPCFSILTPRASFRAALVEVAAVLATAARAVTRQKREPRARHGWVGTSAVDSTAPTFSEALATVRPWFCLPTHVVCWDQRVRRSLPPTTTRTVSLCVTINDGLAGIVLEPLVLKDEHVVDLRPVLSVQHALRPAVAAWQASLPPCSPWSGSHSLGQAGAAAWPRFSDRAQDTPTPKHSDHHAQVLDHVAEAMVLVASGLRWGSGTIIASNPVTVLTAAHVVVGDKQQPVRLRLPNLQWHEANVVFAANDADVAVLVTTSVTLSVARTLATVPNSLNLAGASGSPVAVLGYPLFFPHPDNKPIVTLGHVTCRHDPCQSDNGIVMAHVSATVYPGCSGGPVIDLTTGQLVGVVTGYSQFGTASAYKTESRLAFCIPVTLLASVWEHVDSSGGALALGTVRGQALLRRQLAQTVDNQPPHVKAMWRLEAYTPPAKL